MTDLMQIDTYGVQVAPDTIQIRRMLPGPIERVWAYLTDSDLRRQWLAAGDMTLEAGAPFELTWHNDQLGVPAGDRPAELAETHSMPSRVVSVDPPHKLVIAWRDTGDVTLELEPVDGEVLLTVTHARFPSRTSLVKHSAGWHAHLDALQASISKAGLGESFWERWRRLNDEYERRVPPGQDG